MRFLFIYPFSGSWSIASDKILHTGAYVPPLGILYLAKQLENIGHKIDVIDCNAEGFHIEKILSTLSSYDAVGMTIYSNHYEMANTIELSKSIKKTDSSIPLLIGGPHCTTLPEDSLKNHPADILIRGEGESVIASIANALEGKKKLSTIPGIYYRKNNKIIKTGSPKYIENLDSIPFPTRCLVEKYEYGYMQGAKIAKGKVTSILSSRGCPSHCRYCQISSIVPKYRSRSRENITKEIEEIVGDGYNTLIFVDDNFLVNKKRVEKIMDYIIESKYDIKLWIEGARVDSADKNLYNKMKKAGVEFISFGIESGNQDVLDFYKKRITLEQIRRAVLLSKKMGFFVHSNFILGAPIETKTHIENTIKFARSLPIDAAGFYTLGYLYGSDIWKHAVKDGNIRKDEYWIAADVKRDLGIFSEEELNKFSMKAVREFYYNPRLWAREIYYAISHGDFRFLKMGWKMLT